MNRETRVPAAIPPEELPPADTFLQTRFWAEVKRSFGWRPLAFDCDGDPLLLLLRRFPAGLQLGYVPHGPAGLAELPQEERTAWLARLQRALEPHLPRGTAALRWDLPWRRPEAFEEREFRRQMRHAGAGGFRRAGADIQPPSTVIVPLQGSEDELLARMKRKTRYNIRLAAKRGVEVRIGGAEGLSRWYRLYRETAVRDRIAIHSEAYYRRLFDLAAAIDEAPRLYLLEAFHEGDYLAGNIVALYRGTATYMYGASSNHKRNLMPAYAVQWETMRLARSEGCERYDLFGIPPAEDPKHPMHGLYRFKTGFGGDVLHRYGAWDAPVAGPAYLGFRTAELLRTYYYKRLKKR